MSASHYLEKTPDNLSVSTQPVQEVTTKLMCDVPGCEGEMKSAGSYERYGPQKGPKAGIWYHHVCDSCGIKLKIHRRNFPQVKYIQPGKEVRASTDAQTA